MAKFCYHNVGIKSLVTCIPKQIEKIDSLVNLFDSNEAEKFYKSTGIKERRIATQSICSSDLCLEAAKELIRINNIQLDSIDVLLFMSQTADYKIPATAPIIQNKLGLSTDTACMDLSLACSGFVYALSTAYAYASLESVNRVLLLNGETLSKVINKKDKSEYPIFGDAGSAILVEKGNFGDSYFSLGSNGKGFDTIIIPSCIGGRNELKEESFIEKKYPDGIMRSDLQMYMDGMGVFSFTLKPVPDNIKSVINILEENNISKDKIDLYLIHQANKYILDTIAKKTDIPKDKMPSNIENFGNTSSVSIPLILGTEFSNQLLSKNCLLCGFGAGLSWGSAYITLNNTKIGKVIEL